MTAVLDEFRIDRVRRQREWGLLVINYLFLGGAGAGLVFVSLFVDSTWGEIGGLAALCVATLFLFADLGRPERFWRAYLRPNTSWISRGAILITTVVALGALHLLVTVSGMDAAPVRTVLALATGAAAAGVMAYTGFLLSPSPAIPFWNSAFFPTIFFAYSLLAGIDLMILLSLIQPLAGASLETLEEVQLGLAAGILLLLVSHLSVTANAGPAARESIAVLVRGAFRWPFFGGVFIVGLGVPVLASWAMLATGTAIVASVAAVLSVMRLVGDYLFRYLVIRAGHFDPPL